jgi:MFS family permease
MDRAAVQRRTVRTLMTANVFGYAGRSAVAATAVLLAREMLDGDSLAGIPAAAAVLGTAIAATPLALRSKRRGRRSGVLVGYFIAIAGAGLGIFAGQAGIFWLFVVAAGLFGVGNASNLQNRFTAADLAEEDRRAREISMIVWVGTAGAVVGPALALWVNRVGMGFGMSEWVSPLALGIVGFGAAALIVAFFLRPDPLEFAGGVDPEAPRENPLRGVSQSWKVIWPNQLARVAIGAMAVSQMAMVAVMSMTPLYMRDQGQAELSTLVIAVHVFGMFGLSPLIGRWADRHGRIKALKRGALILGTGALVSVIAGYVPALVFFGLFLVGVGWNFAFIAGSALLTESLPSSERVGAQGLSDVLMSLLGAAAAFSSGFIKAAAGFHWLANFATVAALLILITVLYVEKGRRDPVEAAV